MPKLLIVDDEDPIRAYLSDCFEAMGYETLESSGGKDALNLLQTERPDVILLDVQMRDMNGFEVLRKIKQNENFRDIPVFMLSGCDSSADIEEGVRNLAEAYLTKPFNIEEVRSAIAKALKIRGIE